MNSRQIECFVEVARQLNFSKAADKLYLPQPAVSRYISSLEEELGMQLFDRESKRRIRLTKEGEAYYKLFAKFGKEFSGLTQALRENNALLRFGYSTGWNISNFFPKVISLAQSKEPSINIAVEARSNEELIKALHNDELDLAYMLEYYPMNCVGVETERIREHKLSILYSDALQGSSKILTPEDFKDKVFYITDAPHVEVLKLEVAAALSQYGFEPIFKTTPNIDSTLANIENGLGVALLDELANNLHSPGMKHIDIEYTMPICVAWKRGNRKKTANVVIKALHEYYK